MAETITIMKRIDSESDGDARLRIWVSETTDIIPGKIFVYQKYPRVPQNENLEDLFVHIASYADLIDFPQDKPSAESPYFRKYYIDLTFPTLAMLDEKWQLMSRMIKHTVEDFVRLNNLEPVEIEVINL
jgi:hypothetical protein